MIAMPRLGMTAALLAALAVASSAASCQFTMPQRWPSQSCSVYSLDALPAQDFTLTDGVLNYTVTSPCAAATPPASCSDSTPEFPSPAIQIDSSLCLPLGRINETDAAGSSRGLNVTLSGGVNHPNCPSGRTLVYDFVCDPTASTSAGPDPIMHSTDCVYTVSWTTPLACPKSVPAGSPTCPAYTPPVPTAPQLAYQRDEVMALIHFNAATFIHNGDPACNKDNWESLARHPSVFAPTDLDTDQWVESMQAIGAKEAVLTAKHGCGFLLWPSQTTLPNGTVYPYGVGGPGAYGVDVLSKFVASCEKAGIGHGFYYSLTNNFFLNEIHMVVQPDPLPGQAKVTQAQYEALALAQVTELWTKYGNLTEIWLDGGYEADLKANVTKLLNTKQPDTVVFNGAGVSRNPIRWVGTESGTPAYPIWSTGCSGDGDPDSPDWCPAGCDTTLQLFDTWFWEPNLGIRSLAELIDVYHATVGSNGVLELDFAISRTGQLAPDHVQRYKEFGDWIRACYDTPVANTHGTGALLTLTLAEPAMVDRVWVREDISQGQRIRAYTVEVMAAGSTTYTPFSSGTSVGNKHITLNSSPVKATAFRLNVTAGTAEPIVMDFAAFASCPSA